ncbi:MAG: hypothetical protein JJU05_14415 [Verrucomicrobia bacterium]|nr:hypothetical protein [Verrucomicrobiota bacterium]MCH8529057.1 hypothetical protein [Kiritimatiellia bacterium]
MTDPHTPPSVPANAPPPPPPKPSSGKSCLLFGCGGCLTVLLLLLISSFFMFRAMRNSLNQPPFPPFELTEDERQVLTGKRDLLGLTDGRAAPEPRTETPVILSGRELNGLLFMANPELEEIVRLHLEPDTIRGELRVGDDDQRVAVQVALGIRRQEDRINIVLRDMRIGNFGLPRFVRRALENEDLAAEFFDSPAKRAEFERIVQQIEIQDDAILFMRKAP